MQKCQAWLLSDMHTGWNLKIVQQYLEYVSYTDFSNARAVTGVILIPRNSVLFLGLSTFGDGLIFAFFHDEGQVLDFKDRF